jgi:uncharacterized membrane protein YtjA (UPF0391 family)
MLYYALVFLILALVSAMMGFGFWAVTFASVAKLLFIVFLVLLVVSLVMRSGRRI